MTFSRKGGQIGARPGAPWILPLGLVLVGAFFRFFRLTGLSTWPRFDESLHASLALRLSQHWDWVLRHMDTQSLPLNPWLTALFFKSFGPSLGSLWAFPALESLATVGLGFLAARRFFSDRVAWIAGILLATSFWASYIARFSMQSNTMLLAELLAVYLLGSFLEDGTRSGGWVVALMLGFTVAAGFYSYPAFYPVGALVVWVAASGTEWGRGPGRRPLLVLGISLLVALFPLLLDLATKGSGNYLRGISSLGNAWDATQWKVIGSYLGSIFLFEPLEGDYLPVGGPFLNYILGLFFLIGSGRVLARRKDPAFLFTLVAFLLSLAPALLTRSLEYLRLSASMPFALALCALGVDWVWERSEGWRRYVLAALLLFSALGDAWRLFVVYPDEWATPSARWAENIKSVRGYRAFQVLGRWERERGPGGFLGNLGTQVLDQSLSFATYDHDALRRPDLGGPRWIAVMTNLHYRPFLRLRFPEGHAYGLDWEGRERYGGDLLFVVPVTDKNIGAFRRWAMLDQALARSSEMILERSASGPRAEILRELNGQLALDGGDPFLVSCLWEKIYTQLNYEVAYGERPLNEDIGRLIFALRQALSRGYPLAHLYNELGNLYWRVGLPLDAKEAFRKAVSAPLNKTKAAEHLRQLELGKK